MARDSSGSVSTALAPDPASRLALLLRGDTQAGHALVVEDPHLALTARLDLIDSAERTIDVQYFIWQNDPSGIFVLDRLLEAADRGVRVRALVDDVQLEGLVSRLNAIDAHPNVEVRVFNPFSVALDQRLGLFRLLEFAIDGNRLNHRMHNKLLVADSQLAILGGRNIGDDYFGLSHHRNFIDTDLLLSGQLVPELSTGFDEYWNSGWAVSSSKLVKFSLIRDDLSALRQRIAERLAGYPELTAELDPTRIERLTRALLASHALEEALAVVDDPSVNWGKRPDQMAAQLTEIALSARREVLIVSPYLVLTPKLLAIAQTLVARGVRISVVTNSLASNDVVIAHAAYARFRRRILENGVELFEFRGDPAMAADDPAENFSLHPKFIVFDDDTVFLGSLNLDPRSLYLNTELGVVLKSSSLAAELRCSFEKLTSPDNSWRVAATAEGLQWESSAGVVTRQPSKNAWQRFRSGLMTLLPLSNQL